MTIAWEPPGDDGGAPVSGYEYEVARPCEDDPNTAENESESNCGFTGEDIRETTNTSARISGLSIDGSYDFRVRAVNPVGRGGWTRSIYAILRPSTSAQVRVSPTTITVNEGATVTYTIRLGSAPPIRSRPSSNPRPTADTATLTMRLSDTTRACWRPPGGPIPTRMKPRTGPISPTTGTRASASPSPPPRTATPMTRYRC